MTLASSSGATRPAAGRAPAPARAGSGRAGSRAAVRAWRTSARAPRAPRASPTPGSRGRPAASRAQPVPGEDAADPGGAAEQLAVGLRRHRSGRRRRASRRPAGRCSRPCGPGWPRCQEEPGAVAHAAAGDDDQVDLLAGGDVPAPAAASPSGSGTTRRGGRRPIGELGLGAVRGHRQELGAGPGRDLGGPGEGLVAGRSVLGDGAGRGAASGRPCGHLVGGRELHVRLGQAGRAGRKAVTITRSRRPQQVLDRLREHPGLAGGRPGAAPRRAGLAPHPPPGRRAPPSSRSPAALDPGLDLTL